MKSYAVKFNICLSKNNAVLIEETVKSDSPEDAMRLVYGKVMQLRPREAKIKFLQVRSLA